MDPQDVHALEAALQPIWEVATRFGLDPFPVHFELVPATIMHEFGAYGLPGRFSHWTYGRAYQQLKTMYDYGLSKIYELVINTNPAHAFLVDTNSVLQNKVVVAHVLGHVDFFKHNAYFQSTNRQMVEGASVNAERIRRYEYQHGQHEVEEFLDAVLSIQEHVESTSRIKRWTSDDPPRRPIARETAYDDLFCHLGDQPAVALSGGGRDVTVRFLEGYTHLQLFAPAGQAVVAIEPMTAPTNALLTGDGLRLATQPFRAAFAIDVGEISP
jgi:stage V sporulation protein R